MSYWIELYEDYRTKLKLYMEYPDITYTEFMRKSVNSLRSVQRTTGFVRREKQLTTVTTNTPMGTTYKLDDPPQGNDVETIVTLVDPYGAEIFPATREWFQDTYERAQATHNDFPVHLARYKIGTQPTAGLPSDRIMNRMYWRLNRTLVTVYPEVSGSLYVYYIEAVQPFSAASPQWANFFPLDTNFEGAFTQPIPAEYEPLEELIVLHSVLQEIRARNLPTYQEVAKMYAELMNEFMSTIANDGVGLVAPYGFNP
jgi:hypothetical protein